MTSASSKDDVGKASHNCNRREEKMGKLLVPFSSQDRNANNIPSLDD